MMFEDLTGKRFNRLVVLKRLENASNGGTRWLCKCDCGTIKPYYASSLRSGRSQSCGCIYKEKLKQMPKKESLLKYKLYNTWCSMKVRCNNKKVKSYKNYGGRGINICEEWLKDFKHFEHWAINNGYDEKLTIDRIDNNKGYSPDNCRWVDLKTQARNKRNNHLITYKRETHCISEWAEILCLDKYIIHNRLHKLKWSIEKIFETPVDYTKSKTRHHH